MFFKKSWLTINLGRVCSLFDQNCTSAGPCRIFWGRVGILSPPSFVLSLFCMIFLFFQFLFTSRLKTHKKFTQTTITSSKTNFIREKNPESSNFEIEILIKKLYLSISTEPFYPERLNPIRSFAFLFFLLCFSSFSIPQEIKVNFLKS